MKYIIKQKDKRILNQILAHKKKKHAPVMYKSQVPDYMKLILETQQMKLESNRFSNKSHHKVLDLAKTRHQSLIITQLEF